MSNPWLKKNPFMSLWLSTANRMAGSIRGQASAQVKRQVKAAATDATIEIIKRDDPGPEVQRDADTRSEQRSLGSSRPGQARQLTVAPAISTSPTEA